MTDRCIRNKFANLTYKHITARRTPYIFANLHYKQMTDRRIPYIIADTNLISMRQQNLDAALLAVTPRVGGGSGAGRNGAVTKSNALLYFGS